MYFIYVKYIFHINKQVCNGLGSCPSLLHILEQSVTTRIMSLLVFFLFFFFSQILSSSVAL